MVRMIVGFMTFMVGLWVLVVTLIATYTVPTPEDHISPVLSPMGKLASVMFSSGISLIFYAIVGLNLAVAGTLILVRGLRDHGERPMQPKKKTVTKAERDAKKKKRAHNNSAVVTMVAEAFQQKPPATGSNTHPPVDKTASNKRLVVGWQYALNQGVITEDDLRVMSADELQDRIDAAHPVADTVYRLRDLIPEFEGATTEEHQAQYEKMVKHLRVLREQPHILRLDVRSQEAAEAIEEAEAVLPCGEEVEKS